MDALDPVVFVDGVQKQCEVGVRLLAIAKIINSFSATTVLDRLFQISLQGVKAIRSSQSVSFKLAMAVIQ